MSRFLFGCSIAVSLLLCSCSKEQQTVLEETSEPQTELTDAGVQVEAGHVFVKFKEEPAATKAASEWFDGVTVTHQERLFPYAGKFEKRTREAGLHLWYDVWFDPEMPATKAQGAISLSDDVDIVECVPVVEVNDATYPFDDPRLKSQWHYQNFATKSHRIKGSDINVFDAWKIETGDPSVIVAITDSGVDYNHEDLNGNIWTNEAEANGLTGVDDDGNGYIDDIHGYNFLVGSDGQTMIGTLTTTDDHGTHVAGTVAAMNGNGIGVCGVAGGKAGEKGATLMCCQAVGGSGGYITRAIKYSADNGAVISQNSWSTSHSAALQAAINYFIQNAGYDENGEQTGPMAGGIFITSAGNNNTTTSYPGQYDNVMAVAAIGGDCQKSSYSNYGKWVTIAAPGGNYAKGDSIYSTKRNNTYGPYQGTSQACPHVSGVAALVVSHFGGPGFTNEKLWKILTENAADIDEYNPSYTGMLGAGIVDATSSLLSNGPIPPDAVNNVVSSAYQNKITFKWAVPKDEDSGKARYFNLYLSKNSLASLDPANPTSDVTVIKKIPTGPRSVGDTLTKVYTGLTFATTYHFRVQAFDNLDSASELSAEYTCTTDANHPPVITPLAGTEVSVRMFESATMEFSFSEPDGHAFTTSYKSASAADSYTKSGENMIVTVDGSKGTPGTYHPEVIATDSYNLSSTLTLTYTILPNNKPEVTKPIGDRVITSLKGTLTIPLEDYFHDPDGDDDIVSYTYSVKTVGGTTDPQLGVAGSTLTVTAAGYGEWEITVTATDHMKESASSTFKLLVMNGSEPVILYPSPVVDILHFRTGTEQSIEVELFNPSGAKVYSGTITAAPFTPGTVDMSSMAGGTYNVKMKIGGTPVERRIVKL